MAECQRRGGTIAEEEFIKFLQRQFGRVSLTRPCRRLGYHKKLVEKVSVALKEILADLLATRMMGFGTLRRTPGVSQDLGRLAAARAYRLWLSGNQIPSSLVLEYLLDAD